MSEHYVVGYGSLISHASLKKTISDRSFIPVIVKGYKRIFNVLAKNQTDLLNLKPSSNHYFNGVLFAVNSKELLKIKQRETPEYQFKKGWAYDFQTGKRLEQAWLAVDLHHSIDSRNHFPNHLYFRLCREAAYLISKRFGKTWDQTTYTASSQRVSSWIRNNPEYDTRMDYSTRFNRT